jgi:ABC-type sugar transport system ATPase subunit
MVTHDQNEAMSISDRILLLNNGKIEQQRHTTGDVRFAKDSVYGRIYGQ